VTPVARLLGELRRARVRVWAEGDVIRYHAQQGAMNAALLAELRVHKVELLAFCHQAQASAATRPLEPAPPGGPLEISLAQRRLWLLFRLNGPDATYNIPLALRLRGRFDASAMQHGIAALLQRHEELRTAFRAEGDEARPVIAETCPAPWTEADLCHLPADDRVAEARRGVREAAMHSFDLGLAPLIRFMLWRLDREDHVLLLNMHHIISDGRSVELLAEELAQLYRAKRHGADPTLPPVLLHYTDFAWHQRRSLTNTVLQDQLAYWQQQLAELPPLLDLPTDKPRPPVFSPAGNAVSESLDKPLVERLKQLAQCSGTTLYTTLLAGVAAVMARYTGQEDIAIACPATHRTQPQLDRIIGFFVNTLILRIDLSGNPRFSEILWRAHNVVTHAFANQDIPFDRVVEALQVERSPSHAPVAQVSLAMLSAERTQVRLQGLETEPFDFEGSVARHDLSLEVYESGGKLEIFWIYSTCLFESATMHRMARHLHTLLNAATAAPDTSLSDLPLLSAAEHRLITHEWNATKCDPPPIAFVHRVFEAQARKTPDGVALTMADEKLTYRALNARANQLAHLLIAEGVRADMRVGICMVPCFDMVVSILAVLKAGGAYVPLDSAHPAPRLVTMLRDAGATLVLADAQCPEELAAGGWSVIRPDLPLTWISDRSDDPEVSNTEADLAYVIYTSGSTGHPKGCQIEHRNLMQYLHWANRYFYPTDDGGSFGLFTSFAFDLTVTSLFLPLLRGRTLQIFPQDAPIDAAVAEPAPDCIRPRNHRW
jgi:non-ribosomal peptide synthetase component F